jgi:hypothetical protein
MSNTYTENGDFWGAEANDIYVGDDNDNWIEGGAGDDTLSGGAGNDGIDGGAGNDVIDGGAGHDWLVGGAGADVFVFCADSGHDEIVDFTVADHDQLDLTAYADQKVTISQVGANVLITLGDSASVTLENVDLADLTAANFIGVNPLDADDAAHDEGDEYCPSDAGMPNGKTVMMEDVWFAQKAEQGLIVGEDCIIEGEAGSYKVQLDQAVYQDTYITMKITDGTAQQVDADTFKETKAGWFANQSVTYGLSEGETVQFYMGNQTVQNQVEAWWLNDQVFHNALTSNGEGTARDAYVGVENLTNDFKVFLDGQRIDSDTITLKVSAGDSMSGSFEIFANKEVHVGGGYIGGYATEATENFSLKITEINGKATYDEAFEVEIKDYTALTPEP